MKVTMVELADLLLNVHEHGGAHAKKNSFAN